MIKNSAAFKALYSRIFFFILVAAFPVYAAGSPAYAAASSYEEPIYLPILMYHEVKYHKFGKDVISPWEFESDLKYIARNHYTTITMADLINYFYGAKPLPAKPIMLTFDDGYYNNYKCVLPLIKKYGAKIVLSIIVKDTENFTEYPSENLDHSHVTWTQLNEMLASGLVEVQNHSYGLHRITKTRYGCLQGRFEPLSLYEKVMLDDTLHAQDKIFHMTGNLPSTYTYPYGRYNEAVDIALKKMGFLATLSCEYGINIISPTRTPNLYHLKRVCRSHNDKLPALLENAYKAMKWSKPFYGFKELFGKWK